MKICTTSFGNRNNITDIDIRNIKRGARAYVFKLYRITHNHINYNEYKNIKKGMNDFTSWKKYSGNVKLFLVRKRYANCNKLNDVQVNG